MANFIRALFFGAMAAAVLAALMGRWAPAAALAALAVAALFVFARLTGEQLIPIGRCVRYTGFTKVGWSAAFFVFFVLASAVQSGANLLYFLAALISSVIVLAISYAAVALRKTSLSLSLPRWAFAGEESRCEVFLENGKAVAPVIALNIEGDLGSAGRFAAAAASLPPRSKATLELPFAPAARGTVHEARLVMWTIGLVGFVKRSRKATLPVVMTVYPAIAGVSAPPIPRRPRDSGRAFTAREGDFAGLREWRPGDSPKHVHWRSSARAGKLLMKEFVLSSHPEALVMLDTFGREGDAFEKVVSRAAGLAVAACSAGYAVRLVWYDQAVRAARDAGGGSLPHVVLRALADIRAQEECSFGELRHRAGIEAASGAAVFEVTAGRAGAEEPVNAA